MRTIKLVQSRTYPNRLSIILDLENQKEADEAYEDIKRELDKGRLSLTVENVTDKVVQLKGPDELRATACQTVSASSLKK